MSALDDKQVDEVVDRVTAHVGSRKEGFDGLTREQSRQLLEFFMYRLGGQLCDLREQIAATLPQAYNAWYGRDVVKVVSATDPTREFKTE